MRTIQIFFCTVAASVASTMLFPNSIAATPNSVIDEFKSHVVVPGRSGKATIRRNPDGSLHYFGAPRGGHFVVPGLRPGASPIEAVDALLATYRDAFGLAGSSHRLLLKAVWEAEGRFCARFTQTHGELPVYGTQVLVQCDGTTVVAALCDVMTAPGPLN